MRVYAYEDRFGDARFGVLVDGGLLTGVRKDPRWGQVGKVTHVDLAPIRALVAGGFVPVIAPIALGEGGEALNLNADTAAAIGRAHV